MTRAFLPDPVAPEALERILSAARRAPSAGYTQGVDLVVLEGPAQTSRFWDTSLPEGEQRDTFWWPTLIQAPVLILPLCEPGAYVRRYAETDKAATGLGESRERWPVAYWTVDASFAAMAIQYAAVDEGLGVLFFGLPDVWPQVLAGLGVPPGFEPIGAIAIGHHDAGADEPTGSSTRRPRRPSADVIHRGSW
jgi:nitroreductase